ncbi:biotin--[acetyl-CoA-carboxylase] ligase [Fusobacterium perfoetens]|uniref:biotin--[acetyl-CoA-carboxylase] ligase n=1 Tax=Fusobacterium perfoetens TaxID=852 RepID=UPI00055D04A5|nr:biotin--[acetyl-CoA-carboxylase] ligase [Fusobacterium perfoetens]MCI6152638.1 biotin--[acetyl-CoA-carboxylase] ligase [Fusobacterium perfoetens]MDY3237645.1 biotin--[acetyl-CoA-carboxylase] ligase [Fusobacterium perfoetens]
MTKYKILEILLKNKGTFVSGEYLSSVLLVSRTAIWKGINSLKKSGYNIVGVNNKGYCLYDDNNINEFDIKTNIQCKEIGSKILYFEQIDSTNTYIKKEVDSLQHGTVVIAEEQINGRAKNEKYFYSPKEKGIYMSILLKKNIFLDSLKLLSLTSTVAVIRGIFQSTGISPMSDWNSIIINNKKVAGILTECNIECDTNNIEYIVIGIGINVNNLSFPKTIKDKVTSLRLEKGIEINRKTLICNILNELENLICDKRYISNRKILIEEYLKDFLFLDKVVTLKTNTRIIVGKVIGINEKGGVILLKENNKKEIFYTGIIKEKK